MSEISKTNESTEKAKDTDVILEVKHLKKYFPVRQGLFGHVYSKAVDDVSFQIHQGETLGLVGESGCGKTTLGRSILRLIEPTGGEIYFKGELINDKDMRPFRKSMQIVFQDPYASLDPRMTVSEIIGESLDLNKMYSTREERREKVLKLMHMVGLSDYFYNRYPHEFSGGQRQRIGIARALAVHPEFIVCDEPVSALDVSIQAQVINMLEKLQEEQNITYLFIAHDLSVVKHISDRVAVLYLGHLVEVATSRALYRNPMHPYTQMLLSAVPIADPDLSAQRHRVKLEGEIPSPLNPPSGCPFRTRCPYADEICSQAFPEMKDMGEAHYVACYHPQGHPEEAAQSAKSQEYAGTGSGSAGAEDTGAVSESAGTAKDTGTVSMTDGGQDRRSEGMASEDQHKGKETG